MSRIPARLLILSSLVSFVVGCASGPQKGTAGHSMATSRWGTPLKADKSRNGKYKQEELPFAYNEPAVDDWYDSGYEESLYSPFSFNN